MEGADLHSEIIRQGFGLLGEKFDKLIELMGEGPSEGQILALIQAVQYQGLLQFHRMMLDFAEPVTRDAVSREAKSIPSGLSIEERTDKATVALITSGLAKVMAPPFEKSLKAAFVVAKVEKDAEDALKVEAARQAGSEDPQGTEIVGKKIFVTVKALNLLAKLEERTNGQASTLIEMALEAAIAHEASESLNRERAAIDKKLSEGWLPDGSD